MGAEAGGPFRASITYVISICIINITGVALNVNQFYTDWTCVDGDLVFNNFSLMDKQLSCFKLYIIGYDALHTKGSEMFGFVCLLGCFLHWFAIAYHLVRSHRTWIRTRVLGTVFISAAGVSLLCYGMVISKDNTWNTIVVPAITIALVLIDGVMLIRGQKGDSEHPVRDLAMKSIETTSSMFRLVDLTGRTHKPWDAEKILRLVGSGLSVLIGVCLIGIMVYNAAIVSKVIEWRRKIARVFAVNEDGNVEEAMEEHSGADVEQAVQA